MALAFSGGADSSLLLKLSLDTLGAENVLILTARTCLLKKEEIDRAATWLARHNETAADHRFVDIDPLSWTDFVRNPEDRCYLCKLQIYRIFLDIAHGQGIYTLVDGSNRDDMNSSRPGLRALKELAIGTPLAAVGMTKQEVRTISREMGLDTWNHPSASCLATRIPSGLPVTSERIELIAAMEAYFENTGFDGCRIRLDRHDAGTVIVQVREKDLSGITAGPQLGAMYDFFRKRGINKVFLNLQGRQD